jgi:hypothetical protein
MERTITWPRGDIMTERDETRAVYEETQEGDNEIA